MSIAHRAPLLLRWLGAACLAGTLSCRTPQSDARIFQALNDAADEFAVVRQDMGHLSDQLDSLREVIARQDSLIRRVANLAGVPLGPGGDER
jgi:hypothetical protein